MCCLPKSRLCEGTFFEFLFLQVDCINVCLSCLCGLRMDSVCVLFSQRYKTRKCRCVVGYPELLIFHVELNYINCMTIVNVQLSKEQHGHCVSMAKSNVTANR